MLQESKNVARTLFPSDSTLRNFETEQSDIIQQYQQKNSEKCFDLTSKIHMTDQVSEMEDNNGCETTMKHRRTTLNESAIPSSQEIGVNGLFRGVTFILGDCPDDDNTLKCNILIMGGKIVPHNYPGVADFGIVPISGAPLKFAVKQIVTEYFVVRVAPSSTKIIV